MMRISRLAVVTSVLALASAAPAFAQTAPASPSKPASSTAAPGGDARGDFDAGVDLVTRVSNQGTSTTFKGGWHAGASYRLRRVISVVAEAHGDYHSSGGDTVSLYTYGGGVRFESGRRDVRVKPFAQLILGGGQDNAGGKTNHYPMLSPGGGVDLGISHGAALRVRVDFPLLMTTGDPLSGQVSAGHTLKCARLSIGVSFPLGNR
jgi:hypothetical protein